MQILGIPELEQLVRRSFPAKRLFSAAAELGVTSNRLPVVTFVHGGPDPFLDRHFDAWLEGKAIYVALHQLLNRLCQQGNLLPGEYAVTHRA
jgi:hypothetical protein